MSKRVIQLDGVVYVRADCVRSDELDVSSFAAVILDQVARSSGVMVAQLVGPTRQAALRAPRTAAAVIMRGRGMSWEQIGDAMQRDHSTIMNRVSKYGDDEETRRLVRSVSRRLAVEDN